MVVIMVNSYRGPAIVAVAPDLLLDLVFAPSRPSYEHLRLFSLRQVDRVSC